MAPMARVEAELFGVRRSRAAAIGAAISGPRVMGSSENQRTRRFPPGIPAGGVSVEDSSDGFLCAPFPTNSLLFGDCVWGKVSRLEACQYLVATSFFQE